ncbi:MAG TPA: rhodanese-like domain-containing protein [Puia sp.]
MHTPTQTRGRVTQYLPQGSESSLSYFIHKLCYETEASDVYADLENGIQDFLVIDARSQESYAKDHIPGAINIPHKEMNLETTAFLPKDKLMVLYCDGIGCNASTKGSLKLASLGFMVKELIGGLEWWKYDGYATEKGSVSSNPIACGC